ncbi:siderophore iron transporter [Ophiocordyceps camponoti-floridani]|uniref:Siderophore iron transporter n=1 Tax=Ophiocordyceps camponoti-floridani TaxID=2030778 RepID=A0A8H4Q7G4_9HYPO|nr:siderophore iron transporter [Ophiocordyceps camponoti-floridani]
MGTKTTRRLFGRAAEESPRSKEADAKTDSPLADETGPDGDAVSPDAQTGVQKAEAMTKAWTTRSLIVAYILIWLIYFVDSLQQGVTTALHPFITSAFQQHSLTAATGIMSNLMGGLLKLPLAKILDIWGRPQGFALTTVLLTLGLVMMAACNTVETYAAAQVFYWVGFNGMGYSLSVFIADTSALENRGLMLAFLYSPFIITAWTGGPIATSVMPGIGWRWFFGIFAIITLAVSLPLIALFAYNLVKAKRLGLMPARDGPRRGLLQATRHFLIEFDVIGLLLITGGLALFLLPFSIYTYQPARWRSPLIICMLVFGVLLLVCFALYEKLVAPVQFLPYRLLVDRTILGAMVSATMTFIAFFLWDSYLLSLLQVVNDLSLTDATYIIKIFTVGSCFSGLIVGLLIRWSGRFKWLALYFGLPLTILGVGLMMHFGQPHSPIGYVIMCQIFIALAGGAITICEQTAVLAVISHQHAAVVLAVLSMCSSVGGAIGSTLSAAIWTTVLPRKLEELLPAEAQSNRTTIYNDLVAQLSYPRGSPVREAISEAYSETQKIMIISAIVALFVALAAVFAWRDVRVKDSKQTKGTVV